MALPVGQGAPTPAAVALALLDRVVAYYTEHADEDDPNAPVPLPERRYVAGGNPRTVAWDTDAGQVHVAYARSFSGLHATAAPAPARVPRANPANRGNLIRQVSLEVQIVRPAPGLGQLRSVPSTDQLHRHGIALGLDLFHLNAAIRDAAREGHLIRENVGEAEILVDDSETLGPSGKVAAVAQGITVPLL